MIPILGPILNVVDTVVDRLIPDKNQAKKAKIAMQAEFAKAEITAQLAQIQVNMKEAEHTSVFVAGWRPAIGWVCASAFAWNFVFAQMITYILVLFGNTIPELPTLDMTGLMTVLMGMLGFGGLRTFEKMKGITR